MSCGSERERELLEAAVGQIEAGLCLWCRTSTSRVRWSDTRKRWQIWIVHRPRCRATRSLPDRHRADEFVHGLLILHGLLIGDYNEEDLVLHRKVLVVT